MNSLSIEELLKRAGANLEKLRLLRIAEGTPLADYFAAMKLANRRAQKSIGDNMLVCWYDRDRDVESPRRSIESYLDTEIPGYIEFGLKQEASLVIDVEDGRFVFFYSKINSSLR